jgi:hypothetical protein
MAQTAESGQSEWPVRGLEQFLIENLLRSPGRIERVHVHVWRRRARRPRTLAAAPPRARASHRTPLAAHRSAARAVYSMYVHMWAAAASHALIIYCWAPPAAHCRGHARRIDRTRDTAAL